jgi:hypothetical protein
VTTTATTDRSRLGGACPRPVPDRHSFLFQPRQFRGKGEPANSTCTCLPLSSTASEEVTIEPIALSANLADAEDESALPVQAEVDVGQHTVSVRLSSREGAPLAFVRLEHAGGRVTISLRDETADAETFFELVEDVTAVSAAAPEGADGERGNHC